MDPNRNHNSLNRRRFVQGIAATTLGVSLPTQAATSTNPKATADSVIYLFMQGGMSHLDTFDLKKHPDVDAGFKPIRSSMPGYQVSELLPSLAKQMHHVSVINSMSVKTAAHKQAQYLMRKSYEQRGTIVHPDLGAWASKFRPNDNAGLPTYVKVNPTADLGRGFLASNHGGLPIRDPNAGIPNVTLPEGVDQARQARRLRGLAAMNQDFAARYTLDSASSYVRAYDDAVKLMRSSDLAAFDLSQESAKTRAAYGQTSFGQGCLLARRLAERGVRFIDVNLSGWDAHNELRDSISEPVAKLDQTVAALLQDLSQRGMLKRTMVVVATEFGRTPMMNANEGRDHFPTAFTCLLAGGGAKAGYVHGKTDERGATVDRPVRADDLNATIAHALGMDVKKVITTNTGRPFQVAHKGKPLMDVMA